MSAVLKAVGLEKKFSSTRKSEEDVIALEQFDLELADQEIVCIVGPSGCGKSTFMDIVAGFTTQTSGELQVHGSKIKGPGPDRGVVFQQPVLFPWQTVSDNVMLGPLARGSKLEELKKKTEEVLKSVGLDEFGNSYPYQLSGGMRQRAQIARVLVASPALILMDEPFGALDAQTRMTMHELLLSVWEEYKPTILFITHDVEEAIFLADRVVVMTPRPGRIKKIYDIDFPRPRKLEVTSDPKFATLRSEIVSMLRKEEQ